MDVRKLRTTSGRTLGEVWTPPAEPEPEPPTDLELVCDVALEWAGEYGFVVPEKAAEIAAAVARLIPTPGNREKAFNAVEEVLELAELDAEEEAVRDRIQEEENAAQVTEEV